MRWIIAVAIALAASMGAARADDASRLKVAREVMNVTHAADNLRRLMPQIILTLRPMAIQSGHGDEKQLDAFLARGLEIMNETAPRAVDDMARGYAAELSEQDLRDILTFYRSKAGRDLVDKQPALSQHLLEAGQTWGQAVGRQVTEEFARKAAQTPSKL